VSVATATRFRVPANHPCLPGHFPGRPLVPGVVILDHVQQAIEQSAGPLGALRLPQVKFLQPLLPDVDADIAIEPTATGWKFRVSAGGVVLATGEMVRA